MTKSERIKMDKSNKMVEFLGNEELGCDECPAKDLCDNNKDLNCDTIFDLWIDSEAEE